MAKQLQTTTMHVVLETESGTGVTISTPFFDGMDEEQADIENAVQAVVTAAKATVTGGGTVVQSATDVPENVTGLREAYIQQTVKSWVFDPVTTSTTEEG